MRDDLTGLTIKKQEQDGSTLKLTLSNGKIISIFKNEFSYTNENSFDFDAFNGKLLNENIFDFLESTFFSLSYVNSEMYTELTKGDLLSAKVIIDETDEIIQIFLQFPVEVLKGKTVGWEEDWYENREDYIKNGENIQEIYYLNLNNEKPNHLYEFLNKVVSK